MLTLNRKPNNRETVSSFVTDNTDHLQRLLMVFIAVDGIETLDELYKSLGIEDRERKIRERVDYPKRFRTIVDGMFVRHMTLKAIGEELGIHAERVRQNAAKLHRILYQRNLRQGSGLYKKLRGPIDQFLNEEITYDKLISFIQNEIYNYPEDFSKDFIYRDGSYSNLDKPTALKLINILKGIQEVK